MQQRSRILSLHRHCHVEQANFDTIRVQRALRHSALDFPVPVIFHTQTSSNLILQSSTTMKNKCFSLKLNLSQYNHSTDVCCNAHLRIALFNVTAMLVGIHLMFESVQRFLRHALALYQHGTILRNTPPPTQLLCVTNPPSVLPDTCEALCDVRLPRLAIHIIAV